MNLSILDWVVASVIMALITIGGTVAGRHLKGVADFVVGGRKIRKYLALSSGQAEGLGLISIAILCQEGFERGISYIWQAIIASTIVIVVYGIGGFVIVKYRRLKIMTIPQYFELRYSKGLRIMVGIITATAGILNMAIFPIVGSKFLVYFIGLPQSFSIGSLTISTVSVVVGLLILFALYFTYIGGMVSVAITDYLQSVIIGIVIVVTTFLILMKIGIVGFHNTLVQQIGEGAFNPFSSGSYGPVWMIFLVFANIFGYVSFAPNMQKLASVDSEKTTKTVTLIMTILGIGRSAMILIWGIGALAVMGATLPENVDTRIIGAIFLAKTMPTFVKGLALAGMIAAFISTVDSYLLSWSSIIVNDVICPIRKKPMSAKSHLWTLRFTVLLVALFIFGFGIVYKAEGTIIAYILVTGAMFLGAGVITIGGLYWKRGTTVAAYAAVISCCIFPLADVVFKQILGTGYPLKAEESSLIGILASIFIYISISLVTRRTDKIVEKT